MKRFLRFITIPLFCLFTGGALLPSASAIDTDKTQMSIVRIVKISSEDDKGNVSYGTGTGFIVNENGNIVTNQHVVNGAEEMNGVSQIFALRYMGGGVTRLYRCKCEPAQQSKELDLAVLSSSIKAPHLVLNTKEPKPTAVVYTVGFPGISDTADRDVKNAFISAVLAKRNDPAVDGDGADVSRELSENNRLQDMVIPSFSTGQVKRMGNQAWQEGSGSLRVVDCDIPVAHGNSGGPLLDEGGYVIGVVGDGISKAMDFATVTDDKGNKLPVTGGIDKVDWGIAEVELQKFLLDGKIAIHHVAFDVKKIGHWSARQKILISLACACALVAAGLAVFLLPRRQPAHAPLRTTVINERIDQLLAARGVQAQPQPQPQPQPSVGSVWEFDIQGPGGFRQNVRLTDADFKRGRGRVVVGRNSDFSDVPVKHDSVSRQHLHFELKDSGIVVADRHSSNGTKINGKSLGKPFQSQSLREGDSIQFGELTASVRRGF